MADPVKKSLKKDEWRLMCSNVTVFVISLIDENQNCIYTYRDYLSEAPNSDSDGIRFPNPILTSHFDYPVDVYIKALDDNGHALVISNSTSRPSMLVDELGESYGVKQIDGKPRVSSMPYLYDIAEGSVSGHTPFSKIGYTPSIAAGLTQPYTDIWSYAGTQPVYIFPNTPMQMELLSSDNTVDIGSQIKTGTSTGGSLTSLIDSGVDFTEATSVAVGDCVILDKSGITPEFGWVTAVAQHELTIAGGFSQSGTGSARSYIVIDYSAYAGAHAVQINYLDGDYAQKKEICILNGSTVLTTVNANLFRINSFRVVAAGANKVPTGNISLRHINNTPVYSYITSGFNRARNAMYTVPAGKNLFVTEIAGGYATTGNANKEFSRITTRANIDPDSRFKTDGLMYPFTDMVSQNNTIIIPLNMPTKLPEKTDIKLSAIATATGVIITTLRGWLEDD
jgi:hypothetical protein